MFTMAKPHPTGINEEFVEITSRLFRTDLSHARKPLAIFENGDLIGMQILRRKGQFRDAGGHEGFIITPMRFRPQTEGREVVQFI